MDQKTLDENVVSKSSSSVRHFLEATWPGRYIFIARREYNNSAKLYDRNTGEVVLQARTSGVMYNMLKELHEKGRKPSSGHTGLPIFQGKSASRNSAKIHLQELLGKLQDKLDEVWDWNVGKNITIELITDETRPKELGKILRITFDGEVLTR